LVFGYRFRGDWLEFPPRTDSVSPIRQYLRFRVPSGEEPSLDVLFGAGPSALEVFLIEPGAEPPSGSGFAESAVDVVTGLALLGHLSPPYGGVSGALPPSAGHYVRSIVEYSWLDEEDLDWEGWIGERVRVLQSHR
jgi:hypothetical protein